VALNLGTFLPAGVSSSRARCWVAGPPRYQSLLADPSRFKAASADYAQRIRRDLFEMLRSERIPGLHRLPTAHNPVLGMIAVMRHSA